MSVTSAVEPSIRRQVIERTDYHQMTRLTLKLGAIFKERISPKAEVSVTILSGTAKIQIDDEIREVIPLTLVKLTAGKVCKIFNERQKELTLLVVSGTGSENAEPSEFYVREKGQCVPFKSETGESIYELFGKEMGRAQSHSVAIVEIQQGGTSPEHYHPLIEESYLITAGEAKLVIDNNVTIVPPGDLAKIPVGKKHQIFNENSQTLSFVVVCAPYWTPDCSVFSH